MKEEAEAVGGLAFGLWSVEEKNREARRGAAFCLNQEGFHFVARSTAQLNRGEQGKHREGGRERKGRKGGGGGRVEEEVQVQGHDYGRKEERTRPHLEANRIFPTMDQ